MTTVTTKLSGDVLTIKLNRPEAYNALDEETGALLLRTLQQAAEPQVRAVVLTGEGKAFCSGEDLQALRADYDGGTAPDHAAILRSRYNPTIEAIGSLNKPVVAAINGVAAGAGVSIALACDIRIMSDSASFFLAFSSVGLVPDSGATWMLPRYVGLGRAFELAVSKKRIEPGQALELGLVSEIVASEKLAARATEVAEALASGPTLALGHIKRLIRGSYDMDLPTALEAEAEAQSVAGQSADHLEGVRAFTEKRQPRFQGS